MLTNQMNATQQNKRIYTETIGAGGGTLLLMFAESIPDTCWFRQCLILATPSLSVYLPKLGYRCIFYIRRILDAINTIMREKVQEKMVVNELKLLRKDPRVSRNALKKVEQRYIAIRISRIEKDIIKLSKLRE